MTKIHLIVPDPHATPGFNNDRAILVGKLIADIKPDVVVNLGDTASMDSLASYDKGKRSFHGRTYRADIDAAIDFNDRLWHEVKKTKKRLPYRVILEGNHEQRITRAIEIQEELDGAISFDHLEYPRYYDDIVRYNGTTPGVIEIDGILYAHYFISGVLGKPIGGDHPGYSLLTKGYTSQTCGHIHTLDWCIRTSAGGQKVHGLVAGVCQDYVSPYAGNANNLWWRGVIVKRGVEDGNYDPEFISLERLKGVYNV